LYYHFGAASPWLFVVHGLFLPVRCLLYRLVSVVFVAGRFVPLQMGHAASSSGGKEAVSWSTKIRKGCWRRTRLSTTG